MQSSNRRIAQNSILNAFRLSLTILVPFITFPYTSRIFLSDGTGRVEWVKATINVFILIAQLGIYTYAVREGVKVRNDKSKFSRFAHELLFINGCATVISYLALGICILFIPTFNQYRVLLGVYSINILMSALGLDWVYGVYEEYKYITIRQIFVQLFSLICLFLFVHEKDDVIIYLIITTVSLSGANIFNVLRARRYIEFKNQGKYNVVRHIKPVLIFFATKIAANAYNYIDNVMLGLLSSESAVGYYSAGVKLNAILITFFTAMGPVYLPKLVECLRGDDKEEYNSFLKKVIRLKTMFVLPTAVGMIVLSTPLVRIIAGEDFLPASNTLKILSIVLILVVFSNIIQNDLLVPYGKEQAVFKITAIGAIVNIIVNSGLIQLWADKGAALGSIVAELVALIMGLRELNKIGYHIKTKTMIDLKNYFIAAVIMGLCCYGVTCFVNNMIAQVLIAIPMAVVLYFGILLILNDGVMIFGIKNIRKKLKKKA